jgi:phenylpyruvate tautomerase PptA (4-oxalocrotonate tautomerase family)
MTEQLAPEGKARLCAELSRTCAETIGKPEAYVMAVVADGLAMSHGGRPGPTAFIDIRSIGGLSASVNKRLSERLCALVTKTAGIPGERIYLAFTDVAATHWGHDGGTFG